MRQERDRPLAVEAIDLAGPARLLELRQAGELHRTGRRRGDGENLERLRIGAELLVGAQPDVVLFDPFLVTRDDLTADQHVQAVGDRLHRNAQVAGAIAIDVHLHFRLAQRQRRIDVGQSRDFAEPVLEACRSTRPSLSMSGP